MANYLVRWEIDIEDVESPRLAAEAAWDAMRRPESSACVFDVMERIAASPPWNGPIVTVDLDEDEGED